MDRARILWETITPSDVQKDATMARILAISSQVAFGHVGLSAIVPALQGLGHEVIAVPTVMLSNHYGYETVGGVDIEPSAMASILAALQSNGWLEGLDALITGYMPSVQHVEVVARGLTRLADEMPDLIYLCDPVFGDDPDGLFVTEEVAAAIRDQLVPLADIVTPNRMELGWLTGQPVTDCASADTACDLLGGDLVVAATSIPAGAGQLANLLSTEDEACFARTAKRGGVPHGTGDLFSALLLGHMLNGADDREALARAAAGLSTVILASIGATELKLMDKIDAAVAASPLPLFEVDDDNDDPEPGTEPNREPEPDPSPDWEPGSGQGPART
ncbi:MAG: pyridoxal kinase [Hyphomicrobium sp.]|nr:pyridoxal kinase [Hyphomicrobium sp.]PPC83060.1 MAG: pyridoxal kinase [Hyphomicrobium sp.]